MPTTRSASASIAGSAPGSGGPGGRSRRVPSPRAPRRGPRVPAISPALRPAEETSTESVEAVRSVRRRGRRPSGTGRCWRYRQRGTGRADCIGRTADSRPGPPDAPTHGPTPVGAPGSNIGHPRSVPARTLGAHPSGTAGRGSSHPDHREARLVTEPDRVALVHDYLTQRGGAERVVLALAAAFPAAPLHTSLYDPDGTFPEFAGLDVRTLPLDRVAVCVPTTGWPCPCWRRRSPGSSRCRGGRLLVERLGPRRPDDRSQGRLLPHAGPVALPVRPLPGRTVPGVGRAAVPAGPAAAALGPAGRGLGRPLPGQLHRRASTGGRPLRDRRRGGPPTGRRRPPGGPTSRSPGSSRASSCACRGCCPTRTWKR